MTRGLHWFRNDLRLADNTALIALLERAQEWLPVFVLDPTLRSGLGAGSHRERFLHDCLNRLARDLESRGVPLLVRSGAPAEVLPKLLNETGARLLSFNEATTPFGAARDAAVRRAVEPDGVEVLSHTDHVIFRASEVRSQTGGPYAVYSPYRKTWWKRWAEAPRLPARLPRLPAPIPGFAGPESRAELGDAALDPSVCLPTGGEPAALRRLDRFLDTAAARYADDRDRPDIDGTSRLSPYLRFGAISVRQCFARAQDAVEADAGRRGGVSKWLDELIWREFYSAILEEHPRVLRENYRKEFDTLAWNDDPEGFEAWCDGRTGFPLIDAGMRQLRETGWMHNRVRMIVASFLTKDLLIDWREGERFFFQYLVDGDPATNNGGWQWAASTGTDAQPYFRIFNPVAQGKRWDPEGQYVRRWLPELREVSDRLVHTPWEGPLPDDYPAPILDHAERRETALVRYKQAREEGRAHE